jgi:Uma2 family endonuclease
MSAAPERRWTVAEYLVAERASEQRHEYLDGQIRLMAGASANHNLIVANILASLHGQLRQRPCVVYPTDMRVKVSRTGLYTYPDISVVCGPTQFDDEAQDTLLNPTAIVEVLSASTERYDRGRKAYHYRALDSLLVYLLVAQDSRRVECYRRQSGDFWLLEDVTDTDAQIRLEAIDCYLTLHDIYEKVTLEND